MHDIFPSVAASDWNRRPLEDAALARAEKAERERDAWRKDAEALMSDMEFMHDNWEMAFIPGGEMEQHMAAHEALERGQP